jgi:hypothetical protein
MASGHEYRANRPNTWLLRPMLQSEDSPCQPGAVHTWPIASFAYYAESRRRRGIADCRESSARSIYRFTAPEHTAAVCLLSRNRRVLLAHLICPTGNFRMRAAPVVALGKSQRCSRVSRLDEEGRFGRSSRHVGRGKSTPRSFKRRTRRGLFGSIGLIAVHS